MFKQIKISRSDDSAVTRTFMFNSDDDSTILQAVVQLLETAARMPWVNGSFDINVGSYKAPVTEVTQAHEESTQVPQA